MSSRRPAQQSARPLGCGTVRLQAFEPVSLFAFKPLTIKSQKKFSKKQQKRILFLEKMKYLCKLKNLAKDGRCRI